MSRPHSVVIIGAGVAGLCCAYYLRKQDVDVVIVESHRVGSGASWGNGGWLCPVQAGPLPEPGLTVFGIRALFDRDSALYFKSSELADLTPWLLRFWTYCNERDYRHGFAALARLGRRVFELVDAMVDDGVQFDLHRDGMLLAAQRASDAQAELRKLSPMRELGYELPDDIVLGSDLHTLEPALAPEVDAGFVIPGWHVHPESFTSGLAAAVRKADVEIAEGVEVTDFEFRGDRVTSVRTQTGKYSADAFIIAAGAWTRPLAKTLGLRFPMQSGKGYSFFVTPSVYRSVRFCSLTSTSGVRLWASGCGSAERSSSQDLTLDWISDASEQSSRAPSPLSSPSTRGASTASGQECVRSRQTVYRCSIERHGMTICTSPQAMVCRASLWQRRQELP